MEDQFGRLVEIMAEMLHEQRETNKKLQDLAKKADYQSEQQQKTNIAIGELRLSVMKLADEIVIVHDHERRISQLEQKVK